MIFKKLLLTLFLVALVQLSHAQVDVDISLVEFADGFDKPVDIANAGDDRLFIVEKDGVIRILNSDGSINAQPFLDMQTLTSTSGQNSERGLLGLAFHPQYADNGYFYVNYTRTNGDTRIARYSVSAGNEDLADASSSFTILDVDQPYGNHNGGCIKFGPDGYLYIGLGDGGSGEDPDNYGQRMDQMLGKMLRIDVDGASPYEVPASNPYVNGVDTLPEIWAAGLRNPWRYSFDRSTGDLWIADVGQYNWEEIDFQSVNSPGGENYGWRCYEGNHSGFGGGCPPMEEFVGPVAEFSHSAGHCSVTGGFVYRGNAFPTLQGKYFYTDYCSGQFWSLEQNDADQWVEYTVTTPQGFGWTSFGEDCHGELYIAKQNSGNIYKIIPASCADNAATFVEVVDANILMADEGMSYQWYLDCEPIPLATEQEYNFTENGNYAVLIQYSENCADYSAYSYHEVSVGLDEQENVHGVELIQNPVSQDLNLRFSSPLSTTAQVQLFDQSGRIVGQDQIAAGRVNWETSVAHLAQGQYTISLSSAAGLSSIRFVVVD